MCSISASVNGVCSSGSGDAPGGSTTTSTISSPRPRLMMSGIPRPLAGGSRARISSRNVQHFRPVERRYLDIGAKGCLRRADRTWWQNQSFRTRVEEGVLADDDLDAEIPSRGARIARSPCPRDWRPHSTLDSRITSTFQMSDLGHASWPGRWNTVDDPALRPPHAGQVVRLEDRATDNLALTPIVAGVRRSPSGP